MKPKKALVDTVRAEIRRRLEHGRLVPVAEADLLLPGKMLRTRLAERLAVADACQASYETLVAACVATELVHTASLCHDDVIDESSLRRHRPALWTAVGRSAAVLTGDLLLCEAMDLMVHIQDGLYLPSFLSKVRRVVDAEIRQELVHRGQTLDSQTCLHVAREKTGPLFAFVAEVCAGCDQALRAALEQAGYLVGTAYQLADDLIDVTGREDISGKALGTDIARRKFTLAQDGPDGLAVTKGLIEKLFDDALEGLRCWGSACEGLASFIEHDLKAAFAIQGVTIEKKSIL